MERAQQLAAQAGQMEAGYLAALEKYDERNLRLYDALKAIDLSAAQVNLAASRVQEAHDAVTAAARAADQGERHGRRRTRTRSPRRPTSTSRTCSSEYQTCATIRDGIAAGRHRDRHDAGGRERVQPHRRGLQRRRRRRSSPPASSGATAIKGGLNSTRTTSRRRCRPTSCRPASSSAARSGGIQQTAAQQDSLVAAAQVTVANDQVTIAIQEQGIAQLQYDQAVATLKFLNDQFTNADLYLWMSTTLGGVYRYFLQQATAIARLAQAQLAFERAEQAQALIRTDYWQSPAS